MRVCLKIEGQEGVTWDEWVALARAAEDARLEGLFRSDHYSFVEAGVPALSIGSGQDYLGDDAPALRAKAAAYSQRYHQVTDKYDPTWDLRGMVQQAQFTLDLGQAIANAAARPTFKKVQ